MRWGWRLCLLDRVGGGPSGTEASSGCAGTGAEKEAVLAWRGSPTFASCGTFLRCGSSSSTVDGDGAEPPDAPKSAARAAAAGLTSGFGGEVAGAEGVGATLPEELVVAGGRGSAG